MNDLVSAITNVGFPITLALYLLVRFEKKLDTISEEVRGKDGVMDKVEEILEKIKQCCEERNG